MTVEVDPLVAALTVGARVRERLHACPSSFEARLHVYNLTEAELRAVALQDCFGFKQAQAHARDDLNAYVVWSD